MGTNYYLHEDNARPTCGRGGEPLHIGKSSMGWVFGLHVIPNTGLRDLPEWEARWSRPGSRIEDEYGRTLEPEEMSLVVRLRFGKSGRPPDPWWLSANSAVPGPCDLARSKIDGQHCVGHGEGTWDLLAGDFL